MDLWRKVLRSELLFNKEGTAAQEVAEVARNEDLQWSAKNSKTTGRLYND